MLAERLFANVTLLSVEVEAIFGFPVGVRIASALIEGIIVPAVVTTVASRVKFISSPELVILQVMPVAVPF